jgi:hypothetical protein
VLRPLESGYDVFEGTVLGKRMRGRRLAGRREFDVSKHGGSKGRRGRGRKGSGEHGRASRAKSHNSGRIPPGNASQGSKLEQRPKRGRGCPPLVLPTSRPRHTWAAAVRHATWNTFRTLVRCLDARGSAASHAPHAPPRTGDCPPRHHLCGLKSQ